MKILHTADTHIGTRQYGLEERREDFSKAFFAVIDIAIEERVEAVIHSGDLFDSRNPSAEDLKDVFWGLFRLKEAGIKFMGIVGNHEHKRGIQWLDLFASLGLAVHLSQKPYFINETPFFGLDYAGRREIELPPLEGGILVAHQLLDRVSPRGELKLESVLGSGADFALLGDYHEFKEWREGSKDKEMLITYPGSTERWSMGERAKRGCSIINLPEGSLERKELKTRRFIYIEDEDPLDGIKSREVKGAVVCTSTKGDYTPQEIEEYGMRRGALVVKVREREVTSIPEREEIKVDMEFGDLDEIVSSKLDGMELLDITRQIDAIIRDLERVKDANVDPEVSKILNININININK
jgi:DNA repair exonuclease SbcCD nuclease subunit